MEVVQVWRLVLLEKVALLQLQLLGSNELLLHVLRLLLGFLYLLGLVMGLVMGDLEIRFRIGTHISKGGIQPSQKLAARAT